MVITLNRYFLNYFLIGISLITPYRSHIQIVMYVLNMFALYSMNIFVYGYLVDILNIHASVSVWMV